MIVRSMFVLAVPNLERSSAFFRDILGFEIREIGDPGWRMMVRDACQIMAGECPDALPASSLGDHAYFAYLVVADVDAFYRQVTAAGAQITQPIASKPWRMREFGLMTIDGHRMLIGQAVNVCDVDAQAR